MSAAAKSHLDRVLPVSKFDLGSNFNNGYELWKQCVATFIGFGFLFFILASVLMFIPFIGKYVHGAVISPLLTAGAYVHCHNMKTKGNASFEDFFSQFSSGLQIIIVSVIWTFISFAIERLQAMVNVHGLIDFFDIAEGEGRIYDQPLWKSVFNFIPLLIGLLFQYIIHFVVFFKLEAVDALKYSLKFCSKNYLLIMVYFLLVFLLCISGILGFGLGLIFTFSVIYPMSYESFSQLTKLDDYLSVDPDQAVYDQLISD